MFTSNDEAVDLILRIRDGYEPTDDERQSLNELEDLSLHDMCFDSLDFLQFTPNLLELRLDETEVGSLKGLDALTNLQTLYLNKTQVKSWDGLGCLTSLQTLKLTRTPIDSLKEIGGLENLQELCLSGTEISSLKGIENLSKLQELDLSETQITSVKELGGLTNLQVLSLRRTPLASLEGLNTLRALEELDLNETKISSLDWLVSLNLNKLCVSKTSLNSIPKWLVEKKLKFVTDAEDGYEPGVYMKDVQLSEQPASLFSKDSELIKAYYDEELVPVNEAKVIFLGDGGVGKTYTIYRIEHEGEAPEETVTTPGVNITSHSCDDKAKINFWDFGGQEIMHSMHRCFLTERTCYVVVVSNRWSDITRQARRWLGNIESFAPNSKVILAVNRWGGVVAWDLDKKRLQDEFSNLVDVVEYTAIDANGVNDLARRIEREVDAMPGVNLKFPRSWKEGIMDKLRDMKEKPDKLGYYISKREYRGICEKAGIVNVDVSLWLLEWFNDLGVCFSYHKNTEDGSELPDYMLLEPEWLTNAVYIIVCNGSKSANKGQISYEVLDEILNSPTKCLRPDLKYSKEERDFVLKIMRKFRLSFEVGLGQESVEPVEFVPALCLEDAPSELQPKEYERRIRCKVEYQGCLLDSVLHRLMVDCAEEFNLSRCWRKGLCIKSLGLFAVCEMVNDNDNHKNDNDNRKNDNDNRKKDALNIDVYQVDSRSTVTPQKLLRLLLNKIDVINEELRLKSRTWIYSNDERQALFPLTSLLTAWEKGNKEIPYIYDGDYSVYNIEELLSQVFDESEEIFKFTQTDYKEAEPSKIVESYTNARLDDYLKENSFLNNLNNGDESGTSSKLNVRDVITERFNDAVVESFGSPKLFADFVLFMGRIQSSPDLTSEQKESFSRAIERVCNTQDETKKRQEKENLRTALNSFGMKTKTVVEFAANALTVLRLFFPF